MARKGGRFWLILAAIIALAVGGLAIYAKGSKRGSAEWKEKHRLAEADKAKAEELLVAERKSNADMELAAELLNDQVEDLQVKLDIKPKIKRVVDKRTNPINVEMKELLSEQAHEINALNKRIRTMNEGREDPCPECPSIEKLFEGSKGQWAFEIGDLSADVESESGNQFLVGQAELFLTKPASLARSLGTATYRTDVTTYLTTEPAAEKLRLNGLSLGLTTNFESIGPKVGYIRAFRNRPWLYVDTDVAWLGLSDRVTTSLDYRDITNSFDPNSVYLSTAIGARW
jgi:hypothetical protein